MSVSKSSYKLELITALISNLPPEKMAQVQSIKIDWVEMSQPYHDPEICPVLNLTFFDGSQQANCFEE